MGVHYSACRALERLVHRNRRNYRGIVRCNETRLRLLRTGRRGRLSPADGLVRSSVKHGRPPADVARLVDAVFDAYYRELLAETACSQARRWRVRALAHAKQRAHDAIEEARPRITDAASI